MVFKMTHSNCTCSECERLDALPLRRHGIPNAKQATFLAGGDYPPPPEPMSAPIKPPQPWESLPLFGSLEPDLFA